jgi:hypothetical protein
MSGCFFKKYKGMIQRLSVKSVEFSLGHERKVIFDQAEICEEGPREKK